MKLLDIGVFLGIIISICFLVGIFFIGTYNSLVSKKIDVETQRAQIEAQLQRRFDLVPNLVGAVKGAMKQEQAVFDAIAEARTRYAGAQAGTPEKLQAGQQFDSAISRLLVVMENYPQLKSIETVKDLMVQLEGTENRITVSRERYNESVQVYNQALRMFPTNIVGNIFGFRDEMLFSAQPGSQVAPSVNFDAPPKGAGVSGKVQ